MEETLFHIASLGILHQLDIRYLFQYTVHELFVCIRLASKHDDIFISCICQKQIGMGRGKEMDDTPLVEIVLYTMLYVFLHLYHVSRNST